jgi:hypothetical protein
MNAKLNPPSTLSKASQKLWSEIVSQPMSAGRVKLLEQALLALDRAEADRVTIEREGLSLTTQKTGAVHAHSL